MNRVPSLLVIALACAPALAQRTVDPMAFESRDHSIGTLIISSSLPGPADESLDAIRSVLLDMETAVNDGDPAAYLTHVSKADPFLLAEQTHWADRLDDVVLDAFKLEIGGSPTITPDRAELDLTTTWRIDDWSHGRTWKVTTPVVFVLEDGDWRYAGENMHVLKGDDFEVRYMDGLDHAAREVAAAFPDARAHVDEAFGVDTGPQVIKLFAEQEQVVASVYLGVHDWIPGWVEPGESMKFIWNYTRADDWKAALAHEYTHVATFALGEHASDMPWWAAEGVAELASEEFRPYYRNLMTHAVTDAAQSGALRDWDDLTIFDDTLGADSQWAYRQGHHMVGHISERFGREARTAWLRAMANGASLDDATTQAFGIPFDTLDADWRATFDDPPAAPVAAPAGQTEPESIAAIKATLAAMTQAVLAGDGPAYLVHVSTDDPVLHKEQENWAADLTDHVPAEFSLTLDDINITGPWAEGELTMAWTMPGAAPRDVTYRVGFMRSDDASWRYAGEVWEQVPDNGIIALYAPGLDEVARTVVEVFPEVRAHVEEGFGVTVHAVQQIKIYRSMAHLQASIYLSYVDPLGGWNEPGESIKILSRRRARPQGLRTLLAHEFGHVATFVMGDQAGKMPWWALEGVAELSAERFSNDANRTDALVRNWAKNANLAPWDDMADFRNTPQHWMMHVYKQGQHLMGYVSEVYGRDGRNAWLSAMARGATLDEATRQALGSSFEELDKDWRASLLNR